MRAFPRNNGPVYSGSLDSTSGSSGGMMDSAAAQTSLNQEKENDALGEQFSSEIQAENDTASLEKEAISKDTAF